jgi:hypothetical protein
VIKWSLVEWIGGRFVFCLNYNWMPNWLTIVCALEYFKIKFHRLILILSSVIDISNFQSVFWENWYEWKRQRRKVMEWKHALMSLRFSTWFMFFKLQCTWQFEANLIFSTPYMFWSVHTSSTSCQNYIKPLKYSSETLASGTKHQHYK